MNRNETELGDCCSKCGAVSYQGGYCFRCGTYRPSKHNLRDEELDAASFMEGNPGKRLRTYYGEAAHLDESAETDDLTNPDCRPRPPNTHKPLKRKSLHYRTQSQYLPPSLPPTASSAPPPARPELPISERIAAINFRNSKPSPLPDTTAELGAPVSPTPKTPPTPIDISSPPLAASKEPAPPIHTPENQVAHEVPLHHLLSLQHNPSVADMSAEQLIALMQRLKAHSMSAPRRRAKPSAQSQDDEQVREEPPKAAERQAIPPTAAPPTRRWWHFWK